MIINDKEAAARLSSPMNLINQLNSQKQNGNGRKNAMDLFCRSKEQTQTVGVDKKDIRVEQVVTETKAIAVIPSFNPFQTPPAAVAESPTPLLDEILTDSDSQIKLGLAHDKALDLLTRSVDALASKLDDVKADRLPSTILAASKVVDAIRRERSESSKSNRDREVHYHFYTPQQKKLADFEVIEVGGAVEAVTS